MKDYLQHRSTFVQYVCLPFNVKQINLFLSLDPHTLTVVLKLIQNKVMKSTNAQIVLPLLCDELSTVICDCQNALKNVLKVIRRLNQRIQQSLTHKNYDKLRRTLRILMRNYPAGIIAERAVSVLKKIIPKCDKSLSEYVMDKCEGLLSMTPDQHHITLLSIPCIDFHVKEIQQIEKALLMGSPETNFLCDYYVNGKFDKEYKLLYSDYLIKRQEITSFKYYTQLDSFRQR